MSASIQDRFRDQRLYDAIIVGAGPAGIGVANVLRMRKFLMSKCVERYELPATLAVFAAVGKPWLVLPYLAYLGITTLVYLRFTAPREARSRLNLVMLEGRTFLVWSRLANIWHEALSTIHQFFWQAMPIFLGITLLASLLDWVGVQPRHRLLGTDRQQS